MNAEDYIEETDSGQPKEAVNKARKKLSLGLDLGTLESCILSKLSRPGSEEHHGIIVPTIVGFPEEGILAGILPGNAQMLHGHDALDNELHLRLAYPLSDGVIHDLDTAKTYMAHLRSKVETDA